MQRPPAAHLHRPARAEYITHTSSSCGFFTWRAAGTLCWDTTYLTHDALSMQRLPSGQLVRLGLASGLLASAVLTHCKVTRCSRKAHSRVPACKMVLLTVQAYQGYAGPVWITCLSRSRVIMGSRSDNSVEKLFTTALCPLQGTGCQATSFLIAWSTSLSEALVSSLPASIAHVCAACLKHAQDEKTAPRDVHLTVTSAHRKCEACWTARWSA